MALRLPPLSALRLFEAAGRLGSFKRAAEELNITPSAVSHGVVGLEQALGVALFAREPRGLTLTPEGAEYLPYISEALSLIAIGTERLPGRQGTRVVAVSCAPTVAARWLIPRLPDFHRRWPGIPVTIDTSFRRVGFPVDGFDFAIRMSRASAAGPAWTRLFGERLVPVASPAFRDRLGEGGLGRGTLIHVTRISEDWADWFAAAGMAVPESGAAISVDTIALALEAAVAGLGIALGRRPLVDRELDNGMLVPLGPELPAETAYWLVGSEGVDSRPDLRKVKRWLIEQAGDG